MAGGVCLRPECEEAGGEAQAGTQAGGPPQAAALSCITMDVGRAVRGGCGSLPRVAPPAVLLGGVKASGSMAARSPRSCTVSSTSRMRVCRGGEACRKKSSAGWLASRARTHECAKALGRLESTKACAWRLC